MRVSPWYDGRRIVQAIVALTLLHRRLRNRFNELGLDLVGKTDEAIDAVCEGSMYLSRASPQHSVTSTTQSSTSTSTSAPSTPPHTTEYKHYMEEQKELSPLKLTTSPTKLKLAQHAVEYGISELNGKGKVVLRCTYDSKDAYIKITRRDSVYSRAAMNECTVLSYLIEQHVTGIQTLIRFGDYVQYGSDYSELLNNCIFIITETVVGESLANIRLPSDHKTIENVRRQLVDTINKLNALGVYYYDIREDNVIAAQVESQGEIEYTVQLVDYGDAMYGYVLDNYWTSNRDLNKLWLSAAQHEAIDLLLTNHVSDETKAMWKNVSKQAKKYFGWSQV